MAAFSMERWATLGWVVALAWALVASPACGNDGKQGSGASCGGPGQTCCEGDACNAGGCCVGNACVASGESCGGNLGSCAAGACTACGAASQQCCQGICQSELLCQGMARGATSLCVACGQDAQPCCDDRACSAGVCVGLDAETCQANCGASGQQCCTGQECQPGLDCTNGTCEGTPCGSLTLPCCANQQCLVSGATCIDTTCTACGELGEACCGGQGSGCQTDLQCSQGVCAPMEPCGALGEACCTGGGGGACQGPSLACVDMTCRQCGRQGEPCCGGPAGCNGPLTCQSGACANP